MSQKNIDNFMKDYEDSFHEEEEIKIPRGSIFCPIERPKPSSGYYHYSNPSCQGSLIKETANFPDYFDRNKEEYQSAYQDRLKGWNYERYREVCTRFLVGDLWEHHCKSMSEERLRSFAKEILDLPKDPKHVRLIYYFNVSTGYGCPVVVTISEKD